ncbi:ABC-type tungstate transport system, periplasmic binding protein [Caenispirillum salinarum AK4]|uniref:ABC-type tungstate transport system, periplasmic binding protein n=1 Tax=Caenispirillum salinarum AK4 TaxID=1238182 RepID=K9GXJ4_9PROT|nr:substrate-binding domain-containing protein [Caenispirillum salinarum]EKV29499.1 ABC-type tungstate transport system, periplasmic binding protein [Caenispirillum salinarum AK4]
MRLLTRAAAAAAAAVVVGLAAGAQAEDRFITVASTTSTQASGLFEHLLPKFEDKTGIDVRVVAVGTGKAIRMAEKGDADILFVHHKPSEEAFVAEGYGLERRDVMYNDFVLVGPKSDPAGAGAAGTAAGALAKIAEAEAPFASRGDDSGTNKAELAQWKAAGVDVKDASGDWYRETGSGMGATLNTAAGMDAYTLSDRATWLNFSNRGDLGIVFQGDPALFNQYGVIVVNPERFPHVKADDAQAFADWLVSPEGQEAIAEYKIDGDQLFFPNAAGS